MHRVRAPVGERGPGGPRGFLARLASLGIASLGIASGAAWAQLGRSDAKRRTQRSSLHPVAPRRPPTPIFVRSLPPAVRPRSAPRSFAPFRPWARGGVVVVVVAHVFEQRLTRLAFVLVRVWVSCGGSHHACNRVWLKIAVFFLLFGGFAQLYGCITFFNGNLFSLDITCVCGSLVA